LSLEHTAGYRQAANSAAACELAVVLPRACHIGSFTTFNLTGKYRFTRQLALGIAVTNLFDTQPPFDFTGRGIVNTAYHDIRGRYFRLQLSWMP
jgi:iron complex outermembrane recepter protein